MCAKIQINHTSLLRPHFTHSVWQHTLYVKCKNTLVVTNMIIASESGCSQHTLFMNRKIKHMHNLSTTQIYTSLHDIFGVDASISYCWPMKWLSEHFKYIICAFINCMCVFIIM